MEKLKPLLIVEVKIRQKAIEEGTRNKTQGTRKAQVLKAQEDKAVKPLFLLTFVRESLGPFVLDSFLCLVHCAFALSCALYIVPLLFLVPCTLYLGSFLCLVPCTLPFVCYFQVNQPVTWHNSKSFLPDL